MIWFKTKAGANVPIDYATVGPRDYVLVEGKHTVHFATCPQRNHPKKQPERKDLE